MNYWNTNISSEFRNLMASRTVEPSFKTIFTISQGTDSYGPWQIQAALEILGLKI